MRGRGRTQKAIDALDDPATPGALSRPSAPPTYGEEPSTTPATASYPMLRDSTTFPLSGEPLSALEARAAASELPAPMPRWVMVPDDSARLLAAMNGVSTVAKLARAMRVREESACALIADLVEGGLARVR
jgi:hypothetical protein